MIQLKMKKGEYFFLKQMSKYSYTCMFVKVEFFWNISLIIDVDFVIFIDERLTVFVSEIIYSFEELLVMVFEKVKFSAEVFVGNYFFFIINCNLVLYFLVVLRLKNS